MTPRTVLVYAFLCLCLVHTGNQAFAQSAADTVARDSVRNKFLPTGIRVGFDVINFAKSRLQDDYSGREFEGDVDFGRYYFALEYGNWGRNLVADSSATYANRGNYWRVGIDVNFLTHDPDRNNFFLGARYGRSVFSESMTILASDPFWGDVSDSFYHSGIKASWVELTTGLRVKIWKIFWLGYTARLKFGLSTDGSPEMLSYDVPGFGRTDRETTWGFNYYLMVRIPVRAAPPPPPARKKR